MWLKENSVLNNSAVSQFVQSLIPVLTELTALLGAPAQIASISPSQINHQSTSLICLTYYDAIQFHTFSFSHLVHYFSTFSLCYLTPSLSSKSQGLSHLQPNISYITHYPVQTCYLLEQLLGKISCSRYFQLCEVVSYWKSAFCFSLMKSFHEHFYDLPPLFHSSSYSSLKQCIQLTDLILVLHM